MRYLPKSRWKKAGLVLLLIFGLIQFIPRPVRNISSATTNKGIEQLYLMPDSIMHILKVVCYDCHSNNTNYPWYSNIQPVSWFLNRHIVEGKAELNFDEFGSYSKRRQLSKFKSISSQVNDGEMPLTSYKLLHKKASLSGKERSMITKWFMEKYDASRN